MSSVKFKVTANQTTKIFKQNEGTEMQLWALKAHRYGCDVRIQVIDTYSGMVMSDRVVKAGGK